MYVQLGVLVEVEEKQFDMLIQERQEFFDKMIKAQEVAAAEKTARAEAVEVAETLKKTIPAARGAIITEPWTLPTVETVKVAVTTPPVFPLAMPLLIGGAVLFFIFMQR